MAVDGSRKTRGSPSPKPRPERFVEDLAWLPSDVDFSRYSDGTDLGTMLTDETYDVLVFTLIGPAAIDIFDEIGFRFAPLGTLTATPDSTFAAAGLAAGYLDPSHPLLVLSRRGGPGPFAAVQTWELIESLIDQDEPYRERGAPPVPNIMKLAPPKAQHEREQARRRRLRTARRLASATAAALIAVIAIWLLAAASTDVAPAAPEPSPAPAPAPTPEPLRPPVEVVLTFDAASWLEVVVDGVTEEPGVLIAAGENLRISGQDVVSLRLGNAGGVRIALNGAELGVAGNPGQVLRVSFGPGGPIDG
jgi:hypothetical protein